MSPILENQEIAKKPRHTLKRFFKKSARSFKWIQSLALIFSAGYIIWFGVSKSPYFAVQKIEVAGELKHLDLHSIIQASQVPLGINLFRLSLAKVEQNVSKLPWVEAVSVRRQAPSTLWIHVREQKPVALLLVGRLYFVSGEGVVFKEVEQEPGRDLPVLTGFNKDDSLAPAVRLLRFLEQDPHFEMFGLSEIHYNDAAGFSVVTLLGPMEVRLGRENFDIKIGKLKTIWSELGPKLGRVRGIDLDYEDRAFVKL